MSNKQIAINWAANQVKQATGFVYSDQFFAPFSNQQTRAKITSELLSKNVLVWPDPQHGAFLFKKNDPRLTMETNGAIRVGYWMEDDSILILPTTLN